MANTAKDISTLMSFLHRNAGGAFINFTDTGTTMQAFAFMTTDQTGGNSAPGSRNFTTTGPAVAYTPGLAGSKDGAMTLALSGLMDALVASLSTGLAIAGASNNAPIVITTAVPHYFASGDLVTVSGVLGNTNANGQRTVAVLSPTTFSLLGTTANGTYTSGGFAVDNSVSFPGSFYQGN